MHHLETQTPERNDLNSGEAATLKTCYCCHLKTLNHKVRLIVNLRNLGADLFTADQCQQHRDSPASPFQACGVIAVKPAIQAPWLTAWNSTGLPPNEAGFWKSANTRLPATVHGGHLIEYLKRIMLCGENKSVIGSLTYAAQKYEAEIYEAA